MVLRLLGIVRLLNVHSYNTDISRLCNGVETKSKIATSTAAAYGNHFTNNRQRDVLSIVNALDLLDALVLRGVRTNIFDGDDRNKNSALMIDDVQVKF